MKKHNLKKLLSPACIIGFICLCVMLIPRHACAASDHTHAYSDYTLDSSYKNASKHLLVSRCTICGEERTKKEDHSFVGEQYDTFIDKDDLHMTTHHRQCKVCGDVETLSFSDYHRSGVKEYIWSDDESHIYRTVCADCGHVTEKEYDHTRNKDIPPRYEAIDGDYHNTIYTCTDCKKEYIYRYGEKRHSTDYYTPGEKEQNTFYEPYNEYVHSIFVRCKDCGYALEEYDSHDGVSTYENYDQDYHYVETSCPTCGYEFKGYYEHTWKKKGCKKVNETYHATLYKCSYCDAEKLTNQKKHKKDSLNEIIKKATFKKAGTVEYKCFTCKKTFTQKVAFDCGDSYSTDYSLDHKAIFYKDKKATITLANPAKGATLYLKIGSKTYSKKITNKKKKVTIELGKMDYGQKIKATLKYNGTVIGKDISLSTHVYYSDRIKIGMTQKQVRYTSTWGSPYDINTDSNGYTYWHYRNGSTVGFKNGKVFYWYAS